MVCWRCVRWCVHELPGLHDWGYPAGADEAHVRGCVQHLKPIATSSTMGTKDPHHRMCIQATRCACAQHFFWGRCRHLFVSPWCPLRIVPFAVTTDGNRDLQ
jgi:hypothetical protein